MELIKKTVNIAMTTGTTTGCTGGTCFVIVPDLSAIYHFKISLSNDVQDIGFFDAYDPPEKHWYYGGNEPIGLENLF